MINFLSVLIKKADLVHQKNILLDYVGLLIIMIISSKSP